MSDDEDRPADKKESMAKTKLFVAVGAEGGSLAIYADIADSERPRYRVISVDQAPSLLNDEEGGLEIRRDSGWLPTWSAAMECLGRYPWPHLASTYVDPVVASDLWTALQSYVERTGRPLSAEALGRWREACRIPEI